MISCELLFLADLSLKSMSGKQKKKGKERTWLVYVIRSPEVEWQVSEKSIRPWRYARAESIRTAKAIMRNEKPWQRTNWIC